MAVPVSRVLAELRRAKNPQRALEYFAENVGHTQLAQTWNGQCLLVLCHCALDLDDMGALQRLWAFAEANLHSSEIHAFHDPLFMRILSSAARLGEFDFAQRVHREYLSDDRIRSNVRLQTALMKAYNAGRGFRESLRIFDETIPEENKDRVTFLMAIKACAGLKNREAGVAIHGECEKRGIEKDPSIQSALIHFYGLCQDGPSVLAIFANLPDLGQLDIVTKGALIKALCECREFGHAWRVFEAVPLESRNEPVYLAILRVCAESGERERAAEIQDELETSNAKMRQSDKVQNALLSTFGALKDLDRVEDIFARAKQARRASVVTKGAVMKAYLDCREFERCLALFESLHAREKQAKVARLLAIKAVGELKDGARATQLFRDLEESDSGADLDLEVGNALISMFGKCRDLQRIEQVFARFRESADIVTMNALMQAHSECGKHETALRIFENIQAGKKDVVSFLAALKACADSKNLEKGKEIHAKLKASEAGFLRHSHVRNALVSMYGACSDFDSVSAFFDEQAQRAGEREASDGIVTSNARLTAYVECGRFRECLDFFDALEPECKDRVTFLMAIKACAGLKNCQAGAAIHGECEQRGIEKDPSIQSALIHFYGLCQDLEHVRALFERNKENADIVMQGCLMKAFLDCKEHEQSWAIFEAIPVERRNEPVYLCALRVASELRNIEKVSEIDEEIKRGRLGATASLQNALIHAFGQCRALEKVKEVFESSSSSASSTVVTMGALMGAYMECGRFADALAVFDKIEPASRDRVLYLLAFKACAESVNEAKGAEVFEQFKKAHGVGGEGGDMTDVVAAAITMFGKCANVSKMEQVWRDCDRKSGPLFVAMMNGYGLNGRITDCLELWDRLLVLYASTDSVSDADLTRCLILVLNACAFTGYTAKGTQIFQQWNWAGGQAGSQLASVFTCMVNLHARKGHLTESLAYIHAFVRDHVGTDGPSGNGNKNEVILMINALLSACREHSAKGDDIMKRVAEATCDRVKNELGTFLID